MHYLPPEHTGLDILYLDEHLIALNKPSGLLTVPGRGDDKLDSLTTRVQAEFGTALNVHRLDMDTSGIVIMPLNKRGQSKFGKLFQQQAVHKKYLAVISGKPEKEEGVIDLPLITDWPNRPRQIVDPVNGKASQTTYKTYHYNRDNNSTDVLLLPITGRTHQLRVHMQAIGHSILGDHLYAQASICKQSKRLLLHASQVKFTHPITLESIEIHSPAPFDHQANHLMR